MRGGIPGRASRKPQANKGQQRGGEKSGPIHDLFSGGGGGVRPATRDSSLREASANFSETSRRNCAVRRSVSGATSSSTYLRRRVSSASRRRPISSNLSIVFARRIAKRDSGIIGMLERGCKEESWRFPISGKCVWTAGNRFLAGSLAAEARNGRSCARRAER